MRSLLLTLGLIVSLTMTSVAGATTISGSGYWGKSAPVSNFSAPGDSWSFSFDLPNPISGNPTFQATDFVYDLNGSLVTPALLASVHFYPTTSGGLFDLSVNEGILSLYGADVLGSGLNLIPGVYSAGIAINDGSSVGDGTVTLSGTAVPEPNTLTLFGIGLLGLLSLGFRNAESKGRMS